STQDRVQPFGVRIPSRAKLSNLAINVVFDSPDSHSAILDDDITGARVAIVRQSYAAAVGDRHLAKIACKRSMNVAIHDQLAGEQLWTPKHLVGIAAGAPPAGIANDV